jgi:hypothetical protein
LLLLLQQLKKGAFVGLLQLVLEILVLLLELQFDLFPLLEQ